MSELGPSAMAMSISTLIGIPVGAMAAKCLSESPLTRYTVHSSMGKYGQLYGQNRREILLGQECMNLEARSRMEVSVKAIGNR